MTVVNPYVCSCSPLCRRHRDEWYAFEHGRQVEREQNVKLLRDDTAHYSLGDAATARAFHALANAIEQGP